jgi:hypothetical protein
MWCFFCSQMYSNLFLIQRYLFLLFLENYFHNFCSLWSSILFLEVPICSFIQNDSFLLFLQKLFHPFSCDFFGSQMYSNLFLFKNICSSYFLKIISIIFVPSEAQYCSLKYRFVPLFRMSTDLFLYSEWLIPLISAKICSILFPVMFFLFPNI